MRESIPAELIFIDTGNMSRNGTTPMSIVGVVCDVRRDGESDHIAEKCSVFGINEKEYNCLAKLGDIRPKCFTEEAHRYMVHLR